MTRKLKSPAEMRAEVDGEAAGEDKQLPPTTTFMIDETVRGQRYQGSFTFKVPTIADQIMIGQMKNKYMPGGGVADPPSAMLVEYVCFLEVTLTSKPTWWKPLEFTEADLIVRVYGEAVAYANTFLGRNPRGRSASQNDGEQNGSGSDSDPESDVGEDVPGSDERPKTVIAHSKRA